jgi:hypothetical protein
MRNNLEAILEKPDVPLECLGPDQIVRSRHSVVEQHHAVVGCSEPNQGKTPGGAYENARREASRSAKPRTTHV